MPIFHRKANIPIRYWYIWFFIIPTQDEEQQMDSILSGHTEDKVIMEMAGRGRYSEGYRDDKPTDLEFQN